MLVDLRTFLQANGADLVGYANLQEIAQDIGDEFPFGISIAVALNPEIMSEVNEGPTQAYVEECIRADNLLSSLGQLTVQFLRENGHDAKQLATTNIIGAEYPSMLSTRLPHKTTATRAGLGWIGKCALLITKEFGSAVRITTVLTNAPIAAGQPVNTSFCGDCTACVDVCPSQALSGKNWQAGMNRDSLVDAFSCRNTARELLIKRTRTEVLGRTFCGICIAACPWTRKYFERSRAYLFPI
jgi:epoxyqueuosine reductase QueG